MNQRPLPETDAESAEVLDVIGQWREIGVDHVVMDFGNPVVDRPDPAARRAGRRTAALTVGEAQVACWEPKIVGGPLRDQSGAPCIVRPSTATSCDAWPPMTVPLCLPAAPLAPIPAIGYESAAE